jgi:hypothetical protein
MVEIDNRVWDDVQTELVDLRALVKRLTIELDDERVLHRDVRDRLVEMYERLARVTQAITTAKRVADLDFYALEDDQAEALKHLDAALAGLREVGEER